MPRILLGVLGLLLFVSSLLLVAGQHRARGLFIDLERAQGQASQLEAEGNRLRIELGRLSQPATVEAAARALGLRPVDAKHTVFLPVQPQPTATDKPGRGRE